MPSGSHNPRNFLCLCPVEGKFVSIVALVCGTVSALLFFDRSFFQMFTAVKVIVFKDGAAEAALVRASKVASCKKKPKSTNRRRTQIQGSLADEKARGDGRGGTFAFSLQRLLGRQRG